jgi:hypothetical protein
LLSKYMKLTFNAIILTSTIVLLGIMLWEFIHIKLLLYVNRIDYFGFDYTYVIIHLMFSFMALFFSVFHISV